jgi:NitT/TauT family transport system ATP-binding protein
MARSPDPCDRSAAVELSGICKVYAGAEKVRALDDVTLAIREREFLSVLGPSGCGKSTLLRILAGLLPHDGGTVRIYGRAAEGVSGEVGIVFQTDNLLPWLSLERNIRLAAEIAGMDGATIDAKAREMITMLGLKGFERRYPHELSGGMQQRAAIGQTLMLSPKILLLDEPFGALDALTRDRLNMELLRIIEAQHQTVLLITHSISEAVFLSDRVLVMSPRPGKIVEELAIDLPRPRHPRLTRELPEFGRYEGRLSEIMGVV